MRISNCIRLVAAVLLLHGVSSLAAEAPPRYNVVELQAEAQREVQNDLLNATLYAEHNDPSPAALAAVMNRTINDALRIARDHESVRVRSGPSQTHPVYTRGNILQGWRGRAELRLESRDVEAAAALIGKLQSTLQLASMHFSVSPEARRSVENELIAEAIAAFKGRAEIVQRALAGRSYKLQRLSVASGPAAPPRFAVARAAAQEAVAPQLEAGVSHLTVTASGAIEVIEK